MSNNLKTIKVIEGKTETEDLLSFRFLLNVDTMGTIFFPAEFKQIILDVKRALYVEPRSQERYNCLNKTGNKGKS